ncbi:hypothetical protein K438DRAFT_1974957 [Mycena galopus ATCC 62051]|nr:hypothetical protein K438DRAFT_1974957 [Mycena galopus ATCC 62051]
MTSQCCTQLFQPPSAIHVQGVDISYWWEGESGVPRISIPLGPVTNQLVPPPAATAWVPSLWLLLHRPVSRAHHRLSLTPLPLFATRCLTLCLCRVSVTARLPLTPGTQHGTPLATATTSETSRLQTRACARAFRPLLNTTPRHLHTTSQLDDALAFAVRISPRHQCLCMHRTNFVPICDLRVCRRFYVSPFVLPELAFEFCARHLHAALSSPASPGLARLAVPI